MKKIKPFLSVPWLTQPKYLVYVNTHKGYHAWVGGIYPKHYIMEADFNQDEFVKCQLTTEIKVGMLTTQ